MAAAGAPAVPVAPGAAAAAAAAAPVTGVPGAAPVAATDPRSFSRLQVRGPTPSSLHFETFDRGSRDAEVFNNMFTYARILRERIFVTQLNYATLEEEFDNEDERSRHIYGFIGDAPVAYMRWRVIQTPDLGQCVVMERLCVLKTHRRRGIGRQLIAFALQDIVQKMQALPLTITGITAAVHEEPHVFKLFQSFGFVTNSAVFTQRARRRVRMMLTPSAVAKGAAQITKMGKPKTPFSSGTGVIDPIALQEAQERLRKEAAAAAARHNTDYDDEDDDD